MPLTTTQAAQFKSNQAVEVKRLWKASVPDYEPLDYDFETWVREYKLSELHYVIKATAKRLKQYKDKTGNAVSEENSRIFVFRTLKKLKSDRLSKRRSSATPQPTNNGEHQ